MKRIKSILKTVEKKMIWKIMTFVILEALVIMLGYAGDRKIRFTKSIEKVEGLTEVEDKNVLFNVEEVTLSKGKLGISGWVLRLNSLNTDISVVLRALDESKEYILPAELVEREDIEEYFDAGWNFGASGFEANIKERKIDINTCYEVFICLSYKGEKKNEDGLDEVANRTKKIATGHFLYKGELFEYNPFEYVMPDVVSEEMKTVVQEGRVCVFDEDMGAWIYEHESKLYWIIDSAMLGNFEHKPEINLQIYTSNIERLPEDKKSLGRDYIGYLLSEKEMENKMENNYFIHSVLLPQEYPITYVVTGLYMNGEKENGWRWREEFRLVIH